MDWRLATEDAQAVLRGEEAPAVEIDTRLGMALDLETGEVVCA
jgi:hypothetical protein